MSVTGHPQSGTYLLSKRSVVPAAVICAAETTHILARRLKRSVNSRMCTFLRDVRGRDPKKSTLTVMPGPLSKGRERMGQWMACRDDLCGWQ